MDGWWMDGWLARGCHPVGWLAGWLVPLRYLAMTVLVVTAHVMSGRQAPCASAGVKYQRRECPPQAPNHADPCAWPYWRLHQQHCAKHFSSPARCATRSCLLLHVHPWCVPGLACLVSVRVDEGEECTVV